MPDEELEEVILVNPPAPEQPSAVPTVNPPAQVEVPKVEEKQEKSPDEPEDNPGIMSTIEKVTGGVSIFSMAMGAAGTIGAIVIPKLVKWNTGWKDILATGVTIAIGGFVIGKISRPAAVAFIISAGGVFLLKAFKWAISGFKNKKLLDAQEELFGQDEEIEVDEDFLGDDIYDVGIFDDYGQADTSTDRVIPTADLQYVSNGIDDFY